MAESKRSLLYGTGFRRSKTPFTDQKYFPRTRAATHSQSRVAGQRRASPCPPTRPGTSAHHADRCVDGVLRYRTEGNQRGQARVRIPRGSRVRARGACRHRRVSFGQHALTTNGTVGTHLFSLHLVDAGGLLSPPGTALTPTARKLPQKGLVGVVRDNTINHEEIPFSCPFRPRC